MKNSFPVSVCSAPQAYSFAEKEQLFSRLKQIFAEQNFWCELTLANGLTLTFFGNRNALTLRQAAKNELQAFCLAKRKQTSHQLEAAGKSVTVPHHQILQQEDAELILSSIVEGNEVPDAYHLEKILS